MIAGRSDPPLPLADLRAGGRLAELRAADLRFTTAETAVFLGDLWGLSLSEDAVVALAERTEGWVAGLQLAALSLRNQPDPATFVASFAGSHRFVLDYLTEEVLARQPDEMRAFLLTTSVLERLSGPLCDAVTGRVGWAGRCWRPPSAPTCSSSRSTSSAAGIATTTCSRTCSEHGWCRSARRRSPACIGGPSRGTGRTAWSPMPCTTPWRPATPTMRFG